MTTKDTRLQGQIDSGGDLLLVEISPPKNADPEALRQLAKSFSGKVHALGISDNRHGVQMSALAAAALIAAEGVEPLLHVVTRDRNRIALISDCIGANALGIRNILCTSGTHQTLVGAVEAKNVHDIDPIHLLGLLSALGGDASEGGGEVKNGVAPFCLGAVAAPYADPAALHFIRLSKKIAAGARLLITQPVFDVERFSTWLEQLTQRDLHEKAAVVAGIRLLLNADEARAYAQSRPDPLVPNAVLEALAAASGPGAQRAAGIETAVKTIKQLAGAKGLRGFEISADGDAEATLEVIERAGLEAG